MPMRVCMHVNIRIQIFIPNSLMLCPFLGNRLELRIGEGERFLLHAILNSDFFPLVNLYYFHKKKKKALNKSLTEYHFPFPLELNFEWQIQVCIMFNFYSLQKQKQSIERCVSVCVSV